MQRFSLHRDGTRLGGIDSGGSGRAVVFLHGLAGHTGEWQATAARLEERFVALDARGHGTSERNPREVSREAHTLDVIAAFQHLGVEEVLLVGQSLGGQTAICVAARRPDLVRSLVLIEASPDTGPADYDDIGARLRAWPEERRRHFDIDVAVRTLEAFNREPCWDEWNAIACPRLLVLGQRGTFTPADVDALRPRAEVVEIADAGHDVHLDQPTALAGILTR